MIDHIGLNVSDYERSRDSLRTGTCVARLLATDQATREQLIPALKEKVVVPSGPGLNTGIAGH
jgi:hypothetical protein